MQAVAQTDPYIPRQNAALQTVAQSPNFSQVASFWSMQDPSAQSTPFQVASPAHPNLSAPMLQLPVARHVHSGFSQHSAENFFQGLVPPGFVPPGFVPPGFVPPGSGPHAQFPLGAVPPGFVSAVAA